MNLAWLGVVSRSNERKIHFNLDKNWAVIDILLKFSAAKEICLV